jgi:hypothetical protein
MLRMRGAILPLPRTLLWDGTWLSLEALLLLSEWGGEATTGIQKTQSCTYQHVLGYGTPCKYRKIILARPLKEKHAN